MAETIIEAAGPNGENPLFDPTAEKLRGRWTHMCASGFTTHESLSSLHRVAPEIPGLCLALDPAARTARRFDPLSTTEDGKRIWERMKVVIEEYEFQFGKFRPWDELKLENLSDTDIKTWAWSMRNLIDCNVARHISGPELPPCAEIQKKPGDRFVKSWARFGRLPVDEYGEPILDDKDRPIWNGGKPRVQSAAVGT